MQVAFHLRRRAAAHPATALLLFSHASADLVRLLSATGCDPLPEIHAVAAGFLLKLPETLARPLGGAVRLSKLADNLFLPVDADLLPALLPAEAADLVRRRGLVFLPDTVLEFDPAQPLPLAAILTGGPLRRDAWQPLPQPQRLAEQLTEIVLEMPEPPLDDLLESGRAEIGTEDPAPEDTSLPQQIAGRAAFSAGTMLAWLGKTLCFKGLAATGMKWMEAGLKRAPRLGDSVLGKQEASLRELLRAFQRGDIDRALRRALPLGGNARGMSPYTGSGLPFNNLLYSLRNILGAGGPGGLWLTDAQVYQQLAAEYRRQADLAEKRGDYRRAAFIYGKLLQDYRAAANVLSHGGLHRDAAILYLKRLDDPRAAARAYEAAGEPDRALLLYRQNGEYVLAGDVLRRMGEEEQAVEEYRRAALVLVQEKKAYYEAGELLRTSARRDDLATEYYLLGWSHRPAGNPVRCAVRLAQTRVREGDVPLLLALVDEADEYLGQEGNVLDTAEFYNELARLADRFPKASRRDELRDRALQGIGAKLRQMVARGRGGSVLASTMLGASQAWAPPVVSDAQFALRRAAQRPRSSEEE